jgi:hypothetical protein
MAAMSSRCSGAGGGGWAEAVGGLAVSIFGNNTYSCVWTPLHTA